jgi:flagellar basal-body rod protein FlgG
MMRALSTAATGMEAQQTRLDITANNIANVSTPGFKKSRAEFENLLVQAERTPGAATGPGTYAPNGLQVGLGVRTVGTQRDHRAGDLKQTGNVLDVAIEGQGFFAVALPSGDAGYTRAGAFKVNAEGLIVNGAGFPLVPEISVPPDTQNISIAANGVVTASVPGQVEPIEVGRIELANFVNPAGLVAAEHNLLKETVASGTAVVGTPGENGTGTLGQGLLELSNVEVVEEMIDLISGQRAYEVNSRVIKAADEMLQQASNLR